MIETQTKAAGSFSSRDMLFGDLPLSYWAEIDSNEVPWTLFKQVKRALDKDDKPGAMATLQEIIEMPGLESRQYIQAYHFLNEIQWDDKKETKLFGVVAEINIDPGYDTLAVYADHSARYYNYSGKSIIWENADDSLDTLIDDIMIQGAAVVSRIEPWKSARPGVPANALSRVNFLTSNGLYFGEASMEALFGDPLAGKLMFALQEVMLRLVNKTSAK